jgi:hypothetical protein
MKDLDLNNVIDIVIENLISAERLGLTTTVVKNKHLEFLIKTINDFRKE